MNKLISWLVTSSANPQKVSLTIRGVLVGVVAFVVQLAPITCSLWGVCIDTGVLNSIVDAIVHVATLALELIAAGMVVYGLLRKIYLGRWTHPETFV